ncbi:class I SAM-dependent methyltransferase [Cystobacter fuscus]|uniref:class I SAM-dependent methyltransferase n=1 Tax=Cystobacter fuscus TaxID=43 RepID=UPI002B3043A0|nr:class I SAM-dependent methyltransferase [Cystobacter fuscus]
MNNVARQTDDDQTTLWNGLAGRAWAEEQELLDQMFKPLEDLLVEAVLAGSGRQVLDVGCGTGGTTLAVARRLGAEVHCIGIDVSEPMLTAARARAERESTPASFIRANAQNHAFEPASFDMIISRFGVMFFDDFVQAFANLRRAAKDDAELRFVAWRSPSENPFMTTAERAAAPLLPNIPARQPDAPGQFAFADQHRVHRILEESGWAGIDIRPLDVTCTLPEKDLVRYLTRLGPLGRILHEADDQTRTQVIETVRAAFEPYVHGAEVRFTAACWRVGARAPSSPKEAASNP